MAKQDIDLVDAASATAAASSASCAAFSTKKYDVFISFRGEDTRTNFTSHLHEALRRNKIETYIDYRIQKGDEVWPALVKAIEESTLFLIIFSENYASSSWCLNELTKILECTKDQDHLVIPIFYKLDPSDVRKQTRTYQLAFAKHENSNQKQHIPKWRAALTRAANLSGWPCNADRNEAELIREIIKCVLKNLGPMFTSEPSGLVGIHERIADLKSLLFQGSQDVRFIAIWGMGGIGKTTLATAVFNELRFAYEGSCFLANVREESKKYGIIQLKNRLFSTLLGDTDSYIGMSHGETPYAMRRLSRKQVLIVLDDISDIEQIKRLVGEHSWFGRGSRIIITSRDKQVISKEVDDVYEVKALHFDEALQLFYWNAFKNTCIDKDFEHLSRNMVDYAKGIPLAIEVLASLLCGNGKKEWESQLEKLQKMPCTKIQQVLRLSYDGLDHEEKNIFLDVACFFRGRTVEHVKIFLDACGYSTIIGLQSLQDKALLTVSKVKVSMHDLIHEMGQEIIREECLENPEKRSRLWDPDDVYEVLKYNLGTEAIRGITLDVSKVEDMYLSPQVFKRMRKLKFLQIYNSISEEKVLHFPNGLKSLSNDLRYLEWDGYPLKSLPSAFSAEKLVRLELRNSQLGQLWHGTQNLVNLRKIDLNECQHLIELPDFSKARCLESMYLWHCTSLRDVHPSIFSLDKLEFLQLDGCESITTFKSDMHLTSLRHLSLSGCTRLEEFSVVSENMRYLNLGGTAINALPSSVGNLSKLVTFYLDGCEGLKNLPNKLADLQSLSSLNLFGCTQLNTSNLRCIFDGLHSLESLCLDDCCNLFELPNNISQLSSLASLSMSNTSVQSLPTSIKHLSKLEELVLQRCRRLRSLPELPPSICLLLARDCTSLETVQFTSTAVMPSRLNILWIDFGNCLKLHEYSLKAIRASALLEINRSVFATGKSHYLFAEDVIVFPGCRVPEWLMYSTTQASITIDISTTPRSMDWGLIFCVIIPRFPSYKSVRIDCKVHTGDICADEENIVSSSPHIAYGLNSDHVVLWYEERFCLKLCERIQESRTDNERIAYNSKLSLKFQVYYYCNDKDEGQERVEMEIKECGVCPTYTSEYQDFIKKMELELQSQPRAIEMEVGSSDANKDVKEAVPQKCNQFMYPNPTLPTGAWKIGTKGLKDIINL